MNIILENTMKDKQKTFSAEAVYMFQKSVKDLVMRIVAVACQNGFDKGETTHHVAVIDLFVAARGGIIAIESTAGDVGPVQAPL